ncbi:MAG TPA: helix-turn-helix transcriptional regulator [Fimbriimonadaceae bacterium]|nr:helix-turn-helix transcriptional regulator [Fimbriimonadaceae bacterium]HVM36595.1 helix-turn-helix transcriptional regulator [Actinomycetota bacterium]
MPRLISEVDPRALGERIKRFPRGAWLVAEALAAPRYTAAYISHLEKGKRTASPEAIEHIAAKLGVEIDQLMTGREPRRRLQLQLEVDSGVASLRPPRGS